MGVPVVTLAGKTHVSRVTASLLTAIGHPEWITYSDADYVSRAVALASDLPRLAMIRGALRSQMQQSPLCDAVRFTQNLERTYQHLWEQRCKF